MKVGITLPQFRDDPSVAMAVGQRAEEVGIDGVFAFDHLWPLGQRERPALSPWVLLGGLAVRTERVRLGTLVARVGLVPDAVLVNVLVSLNLISGGRVIAGLGTGDSANRAENEAYGVAFAPIEDRIASLVTCCRSLRAAGVTTWMGGRSAAVRAAAVAVPADGWNAWGASPEQVAEDGSEIMAAGSEITWAGQVLVASSRARAEEKLAQRGRSDPGLIVGGVDDLADHFGRLAAAGVTWAVCAPLDVGSDPSVPEIVAEAGRAAG